jgi:hypothetical protein
MNISDVKTYQLSRSLREKKNKKNKLSNTEYCKCVQKHFCILQKDTWSVICEFVPVVLMCFMYRPVTPKNFLLNYRIVNREY